MNLYLGRERAEIDVVESMELGHPGGQVKGLAVSADSKTVVAVGGDGDAAYGWIHAWYAAAE